jgi:hypothetical protein
MNTPALFHRRQLPRYVKRIKSWAVRVAIGEVKKPQPVLSDTGTRRPTSLGHHASIRTLLLGLPFVPVNVNIRWQELQSVSRDYLLSVASDYRKWAVAVSWMRRWKLVLYHTILHLIFFSAVIPFSCRLGG